MYSRPHSQGTEVVFEDYDWEEVNRIVYARNHDKEALGFPQPIVGVYSRYEMNRLGVAAEAAVAFLLGTKVDRTVSLSGDDGIDLVHEGETYDVRFRGRVGYDYALYSDDPDDLIADWAVLVWPGEDMVVVGKASKGTFLRNSKIMDFGYGPRLTLSPEYFERLEG